MLSDADQDLYHVAGDPQLAEALMRPKEAASAVEVATRVREKILAGEYGNDAKDRAPSRADLAAKPPGGYGISLANASIVLRMLAAEGWVTLDQGRGTFLRPRRLFDVWVEVPRPPEDVPRDAAALAESVDVLARDELAVKRVQRVTVDEESACVEVAVTATSPAMAGEIAETLVWSAPGWSWDGWDLTAASVTARPAR